MSLAMQLITNSPGWNLTREWSSYLLDNTQRTILFWDTMRQRGTTFLEHALAGKPPVLDFNYETIIDGADLEKPVNYALLRIIPDKEFPVNPNKRAIVIVDPRAGHGPGVGGSKPDSQVGVAMRAGHPVYFVTFSPHPFPGQTLEDIGTAEAIFVEEVQRRHAETGNNPAVVGNCQAGWAVASLAAIRPEIMGPIMLNGAPLSYWAGIEGETTTRYMGGLMGGKWVASLALDIGDGEFDGANLVSNFENLNPANTLWKKQYDLYTNIDTGAKRYLEFEKWWGGFFFYDEAEYEPIVSELFIGNKLAKGEVLLSDGTPINLKNIESPIIVFASWGDNITPPQQALHWIVDAYGHEDSIISHEQVIVYLLHEEIGHLGIFVSGKIARKEHTELFNSIELIDSLSPGLYEMIIERKRPKMSHADLEHGDFTVRMERRSVDHIRNLSEEKLDERPFAAVAAISEFNDALYKASLRPLIKACSGKWQAKLLHALHPLRLQRAIVSDLNPMLVPLPYLAMLTKHYRRPAQKDNYFLSLQEDISDAIINTLENYQVYRDTACLHMFKALYGPFGFGAYYPHDERQPEPIPAFTKAEREEMNAQYTQGGFPEALVRMFLAVKLQDQYLERRSSLLAYKIWKEDERLAKITNVEQRRIIKDQARLLHFDQKKALSTLPALLKRKTERKEAFAMLRHIMLADNSSSSFHSPIIDKMADILEIPTESRAMLH